MDTNTKKKTRLLEEQGYVQTGTIVTHPDSGRRGFIEHGRVIWFEKDEAERILGHTPKEG